MLRAGPQRSPLRTRYGPPGRILAGHDRERAVAAEYRARRLHVAPLPNRDVWQRFQPPLPKFIAPIVSGLSIAEEYVREAAIQAGG